MDGLESDVDCGGEEGCPRCPPGLGCRSTLDCNGTASAAVLAQLAAFSFTGQAVLCVAAAAGASGPGAASGGTCTDARLAASVYNGTSPPPMVGFALTFSGVPSVALGALMARVAANAALSAVVAVAPLTVAPGLTADSFVLEAASVPAAQRRRQLAGGGGGGGVATTSPTFSLRLILAPGANASAASAALAANGPAGFAQAAAASASQQLTAAALPALRNYSIALNATVQGPLGGGAAFAVSPPTAALVEFRKGLIAPGGGGGGGGAGGGGDGGGGAGAGGAIVVVLLLLGGGAGFALCRMRGNFFGCRCTAIATCCGKFPMKGAAFKGYRGASDTFDVLRGAAKALPLKSVPTMSRRGSQLAFDAASVLVVASPLNGARPSEGAAAAAQQHGHAPGVHQPGQPSGHAPGAHKPAGHAPAGLPRAAFSPAAVGGGGALGAQGHKPTGPHPTEGATAPGPHAKPAGPPPPRVAAVHIQKIFRGFRARKANRFDRLAKVARCAALAAAPGSAALAAAQELQRAAGAASRTEVASAQGAVVARISSLMQPGRGAARAPMSELQAALMVQRVYKGLKVRAALRGWSKVVDSDGDVFFKNARTGVVEWALPDVPFRPAPSPAAGGSGGPKLTETDENGVVWNLDGPGGKRLKQGWRRDEDETDVWYMNEAGESCWVAPLADAFETDGPGGKRLKDGWRRCEDETDVSVPRNSD